MEYSVATTCEHPLIHRSFSWIKLGGALQEGSEQEGGVYEGRVSGETSDNIQTWAIICAAGCTMVPAPIVTAPLRMAPRQTNAPGTILICSAMTNSHGDSAI